jgi:DNA-binding PadR family transcriptional regulator
MSVGMSLLAILEGSPSYGLNLKNEFEARTGGIWPLNVGQVYTTLGRFQRDGLVEAKSDAESDSQKFYALTDRGRSALDEWLKVVMASRRSEADAARVIQAERRNAVELLQQYTRLKRETPEPPDLGWLFLLDSLIFQTEARVRWLDACESRLSSKATDGSGSRLAVSRLSSPQGEEASL